VIRRRRPRAQRPLRRRERLVKHDPAWTDCRSQRVKQIPLEVARDHDHVESRRRQWMLGQIGAPAVHANTGSARPSRRVAYRVESRVDAEHAEPRDRQRDRMASTSHRHVQRRRVFSGPRRQPRHPLGDERRRLRAFGACAFAEAPADRRRVGGGRSASQGRQP